MRASVLNAIGNAYRSLGLHDAAEPMLLQALELRLELLGKDHPDFADSLQSLGLLHWEQGNYKDAEQFLRDALKIRDSHFDPDDVRTAGTKFFLALVVGLRFENPDPSRVDLCEQLLRDVVEVRRKRLGQKHHDVGTALIGLACVRLARGVSPVFVLSEISEAAVIFDQEDDRFGQLLAAQVQTLVAFKSEDYDRVVSLQRNIAEQSRRIFGETHVVHVLTLGQLAGSLRKMGHVEESYCQMLWTRR